MPRRPNSSSRVTIYQVEGLCDPREVLQAKYLDSDSFEIHEVNIGGREGFWICGSVGANQARWAQLVGTWIDDSRLTDDLGNTTASGVLLLPTRAPGSGRCWAICFGMGFHLIKPDRMVRNLGRRFAVRCADPENVRQVTHAKLDTRAYSSRTTIPGGDDLNGFGANELGDLITRVAGPARLEELTAGTESESVEIRGSDSINVPIARDVEAFISDLDVIESILNRQPISGMESIEFLQSLRSSDARLSNLRSKLDVALGDPGAYRLGLAWPTELSEAAIPFWSCHGFLDTN